MALITDYGDGSGDLVGSGIVIENDSPTGLKLKSAVADLLIRNRNGDIVAQFAGTDMVMITADGGLAQKVTNKGSVALNKGDVVVWDTTTDEAVISTTIENDLKRAGIIYETIAVDDTGWMTVKGRARVNVVGTPSRGVLLGCSSTSRKVEATNPTGEAVLCVIMSTVTSGQAWVNI